LDVRRFISDKEHVKLFVRALVGDEYNVPTLDVIRSPTRLENLKLPQGTIIKPTHASGLALMGGDDLSVATLRRWLTLDYYRATRERNYRGLQKKLIIEPLVFGERSPLDFKFHCVDGVVRYVHVDFDRATHHTRAFFNRDFERLPFSVGYPISRRPLDRPANFDTMVAVAEHLARSFSLIRVDMYSDGRATFVGEITNVHGNAHERFFPHSAEQTFGRGFTPEGPFSSTLVS
jgi:hypothetical protein